MSQLLPIEGPLALNAEYVVKNRKWITLAITAVGAGATVKVQIKCGGAWVDDTAAVLPGAAVGAAINGAGRVVVTPCFAFKVVTAGGAPALTGGWYASAS